ncbi:MAG TPA: TIGR03067 domain-containing protein [Blastocatellia bacterium]|nr:TIGR03067 domain-containing protein [Blastocatellia bacterium]
MIGKLLLLLGAGYLVVTPLQNHKAVEEDWKTIEGTWIPVTFELSGQKLPEEALKDTKLVLTDGRYTYQNDQGTYKLMPGEKPRAMDIIGVDGPNKGKTFLAIYDLTGDTLRICYDLGGKTRPSEFTSRPGTKQFLASYKRAKS